MIYEGHSWPAGARYAIAASRFHEPIVRRLVDGAVDEFERAGAARDDVDVAWCPGAFELPLVSQYFPPGHEQKMRDELLARLHTFMATQVPKEIRTQAIVGEGRVYLEILRAANELKADLIVIGSHRPELRDFLLGSNARKVANHAGCSVLLVR